MDITSELKKRFTGKEDGEDTTEGDHLGDSQVARPEEAEGGRKRSSSKRKKKKKKAKDSKQPAQPGERLRSVDSY